MADVLTREQILAAQDEPQECDVAEWGGVVKVRPLTVAARTKLMDKAQGGTGANAVDVEKLSLLTFITCVVEPAFTEDDYDALKALNAGAVDRVVKFAFKLSGIDTDALKDAEKN